MSLSSRLFVISLTGIITACGGGGGGSGGSNSSAVVSPVASSISSSHSSSAVQVSSAVSSSLSSVVTSSSSSAISSSSAEDNSSSSISSSVSSSTASVEPVSSSSSAISSSSVASSPGSSASSASSEGSLTASISNFMVVDQFGYLPDAQKIAVIRDPQTGFDAAQSFTPGGNYQLVNLHNGQVVHTGTASAWKSGAVSAESGDKVWWFDFSNITATGNYAVVDVERNVRSPGFRIAADVYKPVLKHAVRTFFYQRAGFAKQQPYAEAGWTDSASHLGNCQDTQARLFKREGNTITGVSGTEKDLSGGWFDAGDYNKYTNWHADYLIALLHAYLENPSAWTDDFNIPESSNGIPDLIDEIKWGFDWLKKMQNNDGSVLSILGLAYASPPSAATGCSYYGPASTSATLSSAAAFAFGAKVFADLGNESLASYAADLQTRAANAWTWAGNNPDVRVNNNQGIYQGLGAGDQEVCSAPGSDATAQQRCANALTEKKVQAAVYLFALTGTDAYKTLAENFINSNRLYWVSHWNINRVNTFLYYASLPGATSSTANTIRSDYSNQITGSDYLAGVRNANDAYRVYLEGAGGFSWGSNRSMSQRGTLFVHYAALSSQNAGEANNAALGYLNYLHGTNPLGMVYLSNMYSLGVHSSVNEFYHSWFADKSANWDRVGQSVYGPAPGFLVGGPNPNYNWDSNCNTQNSHQDCGTAAPNPPTGQPAMKSYLDFNTSWPLNSWEVTENHNDYQVAYIRLLSKFVSN